MDEEFLYKKIQEALENLPENFNVLEEQIDVQLQMEYFKFTRKFRMGKESQRFLAQPSLLFDPEVSIQVKKKILASLAASVEVESFRTIEKYQADPDPALKEWATLALQESRMLLQSSLLDEQQIFISTGLGGKGQKLRYFVVFFHKEGKGLTAMQQKLLSDEIKYVIEKNEGEVEEFTENLDYSSAQVVLPIRAEIKDIFRGIIDECNQYGNFLKDDMVITNVKRLNPVEIVEILNQQKSDDPVKDFDISEDPV